MKTTAIIVAAGSGRRMNSNTPKQFIEYKNKPILYYTIQAFEKSAVDEILIVTNKEYIPYVKEDIVNQYSFSKVLDVIEGGRERYDSVYRGLQRLQETNYVLVHDGARPLVTPELIDGVIGKVREENAVIVGVKAKDTIKIVSEDGIVCDTPNRNNVWNIQTPQAFEYNLLKTAYDKIAMIEELVITDDAMVVEYVTKHPIKVLQGSYTNVKITTPEDLQLLKLHGL